MKKYSFLLHHQDYETFLKELQEIGLVHIIEKQDEISENARRSFQTIKRIDETISFLEKREAEKTDPPQPDKKGMEAYNAVQAKRTEREDLVHEIAAVDKHIARVAPWGGFSTETLEKLEQQGIHTYFLVAPEKTFDKGWDTELNLQEINRQEGDCYFVVFSDRAEPPELENAECIQAPDQPASKLKKDKAALQQKIEAIDAQLDQYAAHYIDELRGAIRAIQQATDFELAKENTEKQADDRIMLLEGWIPENKEAELQEFLHSQNVLYVTADIKEEDPKQVPVVLRNNKFAKLFEPIGQLFSLPNAMEIDMTPFFAPFFALFFGFSLGDAGYGLLFMIVATIMKPRLKKEMKGYATLMQILGFTTTLFGVLTGTLFGIQLAEVEALVQFKEKFVNNQELFNLAIGIGVVQILFGMALRVGNNIKQKGFIHALSTLGWIFLIVSSLAYFRLIEDQVANTQLWQNIYYVVAGMSGAMIVFFGNPSAGVFGSFGAGLWDVYSNATGLLGDILSYIRLFALGISSAILGLVFNQIALSLSPDIPVLGQLVFLIIVLFGHSLNLFMASLGAFVHPMRLTFVEFYKNAGFTGGGKPYKPFSK